MKAPIAISILNSLLLITTAPPTHAAEESIADHSPATTTGVIALGPTDTHFNFSTLWEKQFTNTNIDADQQQMSMAINDGHVYVGMVYYDSVENRKGNLFIRRFNTITGDEKDFTCVIPMLPNGYVSSKPVIFNDEAGNLLWARAVQDNDPTTDFAQLYVYQIAIDGDNIISPFVRGYDIGNKGRTAFYLESIDNVKGSVLDNTAELQFLLAEKEGNSLKQYLIYLRNNDFASAELPTPDNKSFTQSDHTAITWHPTKEGVFATHEYISRGTKYFLSPRVFKVTYNSTIISITPYDGNIETEEMLQFRKEWTGDNFNGSAFCLGIHAFEHLSIPMLVVPVINYNKKSQFQLLNWPESESMTEAKHITLLPETPFNVPELKYADSRQLIKTEKVTAKETSRADISEPETRIYIFSPSAGIAAYSIGSKVVGTGVDNISGETPTFHISDHTLYVSSTADSEAIITDTQGRLILRAIIQDGTADLSPLGSGLYIIRVGQHTAKIAL